MSFSSINIQGNIVSSEILDKIRSEEKFKHQSPEAFGLARQSSLRDEIGHAWAIMRTHWQAYKKRLESLPKGDTGTSLTREKLIIPLLTELGYETSIQKAQQINGKSYAISHRATNRNNFPIHIMGYNDNLDKRRESGGPRLSPHALVQEYLNNMEHLYAVVTNGRHLRLLRDATRLVRMSYLEFDLERMFEEELYADFSMLYRVLHVSRMPEQIDAGPDSTIEYYHQESLASGGRIRSKLSEAVETSIKTLANGFLANSRNTVLTQAFTDERLKADDYYTHQLRLIYRILFLIVLEERNLVYPENLDTDQQRHRDIYYRFYSIERLRKLTENSVYVDADKHDLWESLKTTFLLFEEEKFGVKIGLKPLGSGLFAPNALGNLKSQYLSNGDLIEVLKRLTTFVNEQGQLIRVNYSDLDVEEFGSVYEGLLEYDPVVQKVGSVFQFNFVQGTDRSSSGSHYTPEELVKPLIKHSLDYIIADKLKEPEPEKALLSITVCDVACGSGHILLSAARRIATELASLREGAEQPSPTYYRAAIRDVIRNCIYGVDLNPLAVELCKVALWLEAHNPNEPLNFLDHHIKCGNAIVGLAHHTELENGIATEAFKTLPGDDKAIATNLRKTNDKERINKSQSSLVDENKIDENLRGVQKAFAEFVTLPENTPEEIGEKQKAYEKLTKGAKYWQLKSLADAQVAQFFIPKTAENKDRLTTDAKYRIVLNGGLQLADQGASLAVAQQESFFHWFLEFPEVFGQGGFDCILGNPPYLGGLRISTNFGDNTYNFLKTEYNNTGGTCDLVAFFLRRIFSLISPMGLLSIITTNTVSQGDTRDGGLNQILSNSGVINFTIKSMRWPGIAALEVSLLAIHKDSRTINPYISNNKVKKINSLLEEGDALFPEVLVENKGLSFAGTTVLGKGFILSSTEAQQIIRNDENAEVISKYLSGNDVNSTTRQEPSRYVINFHDWDLNKAREFFSPFQIIQNKVFSIRQKDKRKAYRDKWWLFAERRVELYKSISKMQNVIVSCRVTKYLSFSLVPSNYVYDVGTNIIAQESHFYLALFQSSLHSEWAWRYGSSLETRLRYTNVDCIETFPFVTETIPLSSSIELFFESRSNYLEINDIGLTKFYNLFHDKTLAEIELTHLRNYYSQLDDFVLQSYGWEDIDLSHNFYEVDYLPENDNVRYTIHPDARKEVLKRLLLLNHERFEEEVAQGLQKRKDVEAYYKQKNQEVPDGTIFSDEKTKKKKAIKEVKKEETATEQGTIFAPEQTASNPTTEVTIHSRVTVKNISDDKEEKYLITASKGGQITLDYKHIPLTSTFALLMVNRKKGFKFKHEGKQHEIVDVI
jgi:hypothetical protein